MLEHRVLDYLKRKRRGTVRAVPDSFSFAEIDRPLSGRLVIAGITPEDGPGLTFEEAGDDPRVAWVPPKASTASRNISLKSMRSTRGHMVDFARNQVLMFESILEYLLANMLLARPDIVKIEDQPPELKFTLDGKKLRHTLDYRSSFGDGFRIGYAVKPADMLERDQTKRKVEAMIAQHAPKFAHHMVVCTEFEITKDKGWNAFDINEARRARNQAQCDRVLERLLSIGSAIEIWRLQEMIGDESIVWNALLCLHFDRLVQIARPGFRFTDAGLVRAIRR